MSQGLQMHPWAAKCGYGLSAWRDTHQGPSPAPLLQGFFNDVRHHRHLRGLALEFDAWENYYKAIVQSMGYNRDRDEIVAHQLSNMLETRVDQLVTLDRLRDLLEKKHVFVFGDGPSLKDDIQGFDFMSTKVSADGATSKIMDAGIMPDIIVTDLDGKVEDQVEANREGAIVIIHAHGDNQDLVKEWVPRFEGPILGTTQSTPIDRVHNFGGFTDGDRCAFLCDHFNAASIILIAFNFDDTDQEYLQGLGPTKLKKLTWGGMLLSALEGSELFFFEDLVEVYHGEEAGPLPDADGLVQDFVGAFSSDPDDDTAS